MLIKLFIGLLAAYLLLMLLIYWRQDQLLFRTHQALPETPEDYGLDYEDLQLQTADGVTINGWYLPHKESAYALIFLHGNSDNLSNIIPSLRLFQQMGFNCLAIDYRGYGRSQGQPSEKGTYLDAEAAWVYLLRERGFRREQIVILGRSLGGAVGAWLATRHRPAALVLESTYTRLQDIAGEHYPYLPVARLLRYRYPTIDRLPQIKAPVLIIHSPEDEVIPFAHGQQLFQAARQPKAFLAIQGQHYDGHETSGEIYIQGLRSFFDDHLEMPLSALIK